MLCVQAGISLCLAERAPGAWQWNLPWGNTLLRSLPKLPIASASTFSWTNENNKLLCRGTCNMCLLLWKNLDRSLKESKIGYCLGYLLENNVSLSKKTQDCWVYLNLVVGFFWWKQKWNKTTYRLWIKMLATFGGNLWIKLFWYLLLLRKTWINFSVLDFFAYLNGKGSKCHSTSREQNCRGRKGFHKLTQKTGVHLETPNYFFWFLLFTVLMSFHIKTPKWWRYSMTLMPYERGAQGFRRENYGSAFFLAEPFCSP